MKNREIGLGIVILGIAQFLITLISIIYQYVYGVYSITSLSTIAGIISILATPAILLLIGIYIMKN